MLGTLGELHKRTLDSNNGAAPEAIQSREWLAWLAATKSAAQKLQTSSAIGLRCRYNGDLFETGAANISATGQLQELISLVRRRTPRAWNHTYSVDVHGDASQARLLPASTAAMCAAWCG